MDLHVFKLALTAFFLAAFFKGLTGLGFATLCLGFIALFIDIRLAIPLVFLPSLSSNIMVMIDSGRFMESFKRFWLLYLSAVPGLILGIWFLGTCRNDAPRVILGVVMVLYGLYGLTSGIRAISRDWERRLMVPIGLLSGLVNGATGSQIMPVMPYLLSLKMDRELFVQTINSSFTFSTLIMMAGLGKMGMVSIPVLGVSLAGIIPVAAGIMLGSRIRRRVSETFYRKMVLILLVLLGSVLVFRPFVSSGSPDRTVRAYHETIYPAS